MTTFRDKIDNFLDKSEDIIDEVKDKTEDGINGVKAKAEEWKDKVCDTQTELKRKSGIIGENLKKTAADLKKQAPDVKMKKFTLSEALQVAQKLNIDFEKAGFTPEEYLEGMNIELEHGIVDAHTNVTNNDPLVTGKIALAHLNEISIYYNDDIGLEAWEHAVEAFKGDPKGKKIQIV
jgi:vacuolar-type H+-ATPase subunit H